MDTGLTEPAAAETYLPLRKVLAVGAGNALDFYDFVTFSFFAVQIGHCFFPAGTTKNGLLYSLATFGVGFLTRPLGAVVIGIYADRAGRRAAMVLSFSLMGAAITGLALTPSYTRIGVAAPLLLVLFRLLQGFALGGEVGPSTAYLIEVAPPLKRGLYVALQYATQDLAVLAAGLVGFTLANALDAASLDAWGWRVAFLLGACIVPMGVLMRRNLPETFTAEAPAARRAAKFPLRTVVLGVMMIAAAVTTNYGLDYMTTFAQDSLHMAANTAFGATVVLGLVQFCSDLSSGLLSDRFGRKPVMVMASGLLLVLVVPAYLAMIYRPGVAALYGATAVLGMLQSLATGPALITITELLPRSARSAVLGTIYAVGATVFGSVTQFNIKWIIDATGSHLAPAWYIAAAVCVGLAAMMVVKETAPVKAGLG